MQFATRFVVLAVVCAALVSANVPIPLRPEGYGVGGPADAHVVVEMFLDSICRECKTAWSTAQQLMQTYGTRIHFRIHSFPLPQHISGYILSQGLHVIANATNRNVDAIFQFVSKVFDNQDRWSNDVSVSMTPTQVIDSLASFVADSGFTSKANFLAGMNNGDIAFQTRVSWKYACSRGIVGTPTFLVNGVAIDADDSWTLTQWKALIDPILAANYAATGPNVKDCPSTQVQCDYAPHKSQCCLAGERCIPNVGCRC